MHTARLFITGTSGTGKSAVVRALNGRGIPALDTDDFGRWHHKGTGAPAASYPGSEDPWDEKTQWHRTHHWLLDADRLRKTLAEDRIRAVAGLAANQNEFADLFTTTLLLRCPEETFVRRILQRTDSAYGKDAAERRQILSLYKGIEADTLAQGAVPVDADRPLEQVVADILSHMA